MFKRIDHVELIPADYERTMKFYIDILGFKLRDSYPVDAPPLAEVAYLTLGNTVVELMRVNGAVPASVKAWQVGYHALALEVSDMEAAVKYLTGKGVPIAWGPVSLGKSKRAEIKDPDGLTIELRQW